MSFICCISMMEYIKPYQTNICARYKRDEQPVRVGFWYIGVGCATIIGSLMSFGFQHYGGKIFSAWQIMFLVIGLITVSMGAVVILFLPDNPMSARRLSHAEKVAAVERLERTRPASRTSTSSLIRSGSALRTRRLGCSLSLPSQPQFRMERSVASSRS